MSGSTLTFRTPAPTDLFIEDGAGDNTTTGVEAGDSGTPFADSFMVSDSESNPNQPCRAEISTHVGDGTDPAKGPFIRLQAETGVSRFFDLTILPDVADTVPTLQLTLPSNDVDISATAGAIVAYLRITASAGAGLPGAVYKIPLYHS